MSVEMSKFLMGEVTLSRAVPPLRKEKVSSGMQLLKEVDQQCCPKLSPKQEFSGLMGTGLGISTLEKSPKRIC